MRLNTNISAIIANNALQKVQDRLSNSIQKLSSGYKINSSADDPAGCAISEKMRVQLRGLSQSDNNVTDGISVLNTAEGGLIEIQSMLTRMKELSVQAANDVNSDDERSAIQGEIDNINKEIDRISSQTEFNTQSLIDGNLSRRVYSDCQGVNQITCSENFVTGDYGITVTEDARQAIVVGEGTITLGANDKITKEQEGVIELNGYKVSVSEGDDLNTIMGKLVDAASIIGGSAFAVTDTTNDTTANGMDYAGYSPVTTYPGSRLVIMTKEYGSSQSIEVKCSNKELAQALGIDSAADDDGFVVQGSDVKAEFTTDANGKRVGFDDSAVLSTSGTRITVKDVNNKSFEMDVPGNVAGTKFDDTGKIPVSTGTSSKDIVQEVTDVGTMSIHVGANQDQVIRIDIPEVTTYTLGIDTVNVMTGLTASQSIEKVDKAINRASSVRSKIGSYQNRFEHTQNNIAVSNENLTSALSAMTDTDMAEEMTEYTSVNVMTQAATSILAQANERPSTVLQILQ